MFADISRDEQITEFVQQTLSTKPDSFRRRFAAMLSTLSDSDWEVLERMACTIIAERPAIALVPAEPDTRSREEKPLSIDEQVELYRQQLLLEEEREKQAPFVSGSGAG